MSMTSLPERFWTKVDKSHEGGCWQWTAGVNPHGYGRFFLDGGQMAHRLAYADVRGEIPKPLVIDHLCRNRRCVNPDHMEAVHIVTNVMRGQGAGALHSKQTECKQGHPLTAGNVRINKHGHRICRTCEAKWQAAYAVRKKSRKPQI